MAKILIVEDNHELLELYASVLRHAFHDVKMAHNGQEALNHLADEACDLIVTDIMMPVVDGYTLVEELRTSHYTMPILMISAKDSIHDKGLGFKVGIDDYVVKPVDLEELVWRVNALLKRSQIQTEHKITINETLINQETLSIRYQGVETVLPPKEFHILFELASNPQRIFTRIELIERVWGLDYLEDMHTLDVHMSRLRDKLKDHSDLKITTVRGLGYRMVNHEA